ncbi:MAG: acid phosphatase [Methylophilaceae bacterium]
MDGHDGLSLNLKPRLMQVSIALGCILLASCAHAPAAQKATANKLSDIQHIIVIYAENRSFDNLYGLFPGANGIRNATPAQYTQIDHDGKPFQFLPPITGQGVAGDSQASELLTRLPNQPFRLDSAELKLPLSVQTRDLVHRFYQNIEQINGGQNNKFAAVSDAGGLVMGYYDGSKLPLWKWAQEYVLADNFFMAAFGGSYLNHQWLICACTPLDGDAPPAARAQVDANGYLKRRADSPTSALQGAPKLLDGAVSPDGYSINSANSAYQPSGIAPAPGGDERYANVAEHPLPPQTASTIGDTLSAKNITWAWYAGGWNLAVEDAKLARDKRRIIYTSTFGTINFQPHHQPFNYFQRFAPGTPDRAQHLQDGETFLSAISNGSLPQVSFYKPSGDLNEHPGYTNVLSGDQHISAILERIRHSPIWSNTVVIVTYDENGGFWDHVAPPQGDRWGPGTRIPAIVVSPFAKRGFVDHTAYDTTSIIKFITRRFDLQPLSGVRVQAGDLLNALNIKQ